jgi:hypothetical protein
MKKTTPECKIEVVNDAPGDGTTVYVVFNGKRIARRGYPGTPYAKQWVSLEPGYVVRDAKRGREIVVEYNGVLVN